MTNSFNLDFLDRTLRSTGIVLLIFLPFGLYYFGIFQSIAIFSGGVWGMINFIFISAIVRAYVRDGKPDKFKSISLALVKFPLLYASGYFLLKVDQFEPLYLLIGFTSLMLVMVLKALGRTFMALDDDSETGDKLQKANS